MAESCAGCFRVSILSVFDDCLWQKQAKEKDSMQVKLFVGNLPWSVGDTELEDLFADQGTRAKCAGHYRSGDWSLTRFRVRRD